MGYAGDSAVGNFLNVIRHVMEMMKNCESNKNSKDKSHFSAKKWVGISPKNPKIKTGTLMKLIRGSFKIIF